METLLSLTGSFINVALVVVGGCLGLLLKKGLPERVSDAVMKALGLCVLFIGIDGCLEGENTLVTVISIIMYRKTVLVILFTPINVTVIQFLPSTASLKKLKCLTPHRN